MANMPRIVYGSMAGVILGAVLFIAVVALVKRVILHQIEEQLTDLKIHASETSLDLVSRSVTFHEVSWGDQNTVGSNTPGSLHIRGVQLKGIRIVPLILRNALHARSLIIDSGSVEINKNYVRSRSNTSNLIGLSIDSIQIINVYLAVLNDTALQFHGMVDLMIGGLQIPNVTDMTPWLTSRFDFFNIQLRGLQFHETGSLYTTDVQKFSVNSVKKSLTIDSLTLSPLYGKYEFARKKGKQTDRITLTIPKITVSGIDLSRLKDSVVHILDISIRNTHLQLFRDKRVAFVPGNDIPLPLEMISKRPFTIAIDSVHVHNANIFYEVFPERGFHAGNVSFDKLEATMDHISNHKYYKNIKQATLVAHANLQEKGFIKASFTIPYGKRQRYTAVGAITHLPLPLLNPLVENVAFTRMVSGKLNRLKFKFEYNDLSSAGSILIDYEDLKVQSLTKEKDATPNEFKSFLLNVLLRNNKGKSVSKEKRTGVIKFERDRQKPIFNLWIQSILSGLENSVIELPGKNKD